MNREKLKAKYSAAFDEILPKHGEGNPPDTVQANYFTAEAAARQLQEYLSNYGAQPVFTTSTGTGGH